MIFDLSAFKPFKIVYTHFYRIKVLPLFSIVFIVNKSSLCLSLVQLSVLGCGALLKSQSVDESVQNCSLIIL